MRENYRLRPLALFATVMSHNAVWSVTPSGPMYAGRTHSSPQTHRNILPHYSRFAGGVLPAAPAQFVLIRGNVSYGSPLRSVHPPVRGTHESAGWSWTNRSGNDRASQCATRVWPGGD